MARCYLVILAGLYRLMMRDPDMRTEEGELIEEETYDCEIDDGEQWISGLGDSLYALPFCHTRHPGRKYL